MYSTKSKTSKDKNYKKLAIFLVILVSVVGVLVILERTGVINLYSKTVSEDTNSSVNTINYNPPTQEEATAGDVQKEEIINQPENEPAGQANVVIVDASQYGEQIEVRAFVSNFVMDGNCKFTFTKEGEDTIEKETQAYADASSTPCVALTIPKSVFTSNGGWELTVSYTNSKSNGSATQQVIIQ